MSMPRWALWFVMQFYFFVMICALMMMPFIVWGDLGSSEETWTDFSPKVVEKNIYYVLPTDKAEELKENAEAKLDKEKYRVYFEDKSLVLMVLGGLEYWKMNCGTLSGTGDYFMNLAMKKHAIDIDEMNMDMSFQTGLFAATLYNDCDIFLEQTKSIGLGMMFKKTPQEIILDTVPEANI
jgi:hypothetical protein